VKKYIYERRIMNGDPTRWWPVLSFWENGENQSDLTHDDVSFIIQNRSDYLEVIKT